MRHRLTRSFCGLARRVERRDTPGLPAGFSLVELVVIFVVAGILAAVATARFVGRGGFESRGYADQAITVVRNAQKTAIAQRRNVIVVISADRIAVCYVAACGAPLAVTVPAPFSIPKTTTAAQANCGGNPNWLCAGSPAAEITLASATANFTFNSLGRTNLGAPLVIGVNTTVPGEANRTLTVEIETGYVHP